MGGFLLGPIKKPVSSSVSKSLLWHSRQLRKHLKAPEKPDNTSLVECRVPLEGRRDFAPYQRDIPPPFPMCCNIDSILCIKHRAPFPRAPIPESSHETRRARVREIPLSCLIPPSSVFTYIYIYKSHMSSLTRLISPTCIIK